MSVLFYNSRNYTLNVVFVRVLSIISILQMNTVAHMFLKNFSRQYFDVVKNATMNKRFIIMNVM
jgi:hypothetical protein